MNSTKVFAILIGASLAAVPARGQGDVEAIVGQNVRPILPQNGRGGGVAVAVCMNGQTKPSSGWAPAKSIRRRATRLRS
jgi:hypothetical protein